MPPRVFVKEEVMSDEELATDDEEGLPELVQEKPKVSVSRQFQEIEKTQALTRGNRQRNKTEKGKAYEKETKKNCAAITLDIPKSIEEANSSPNSSFWNDAINSERNAMFANRVFEFVARPSNRRTVKSKWIFDNKVNEHGEVIRYKARLCAKGFTQIFGIDYCQTYAPTVDRSSINILLTYCLHNNLNVMQFDVETAFLQAPLEQGCRYSRY